MSRINVPFIPPLSGTAKSLVVFLHGYGANGNDLLSIGEEWADTLPDTAFVSPDAPEVCEAFAGGFQWFSIRALSEDKSAREKQVARVTPLLHGFLDEQLNHWGVDESKLAVAGFSQGAMMAMYAMPRRQKPCAAIIGYSGMLIDAEGLKAPSIVKMPILAIHGAVDDIVPPHSLAEAQDGFAAAGFDVETILRPNLAHGIDHIGMTRGLSFIKEAFEK